jgi:hypothetical protein
MKKHCLIFFVFLVLYSCTGDELTDKEFDGYYHPVERISLEFKSGRRVIGRIRSTEFVGRFHDKIYGHYDYAFPNVYISWDRSALENQVYRKKPADPDSIILHNSLDTIELYESGATYVLLKNSTTKAERTRGDMQALFFDFFLLLALVLPVIMCLLVIVGLVWFKQTGT